METTSQTPRTDAQCYDCAYRGDMGSTFTADRGKLDPYGENVSADFARQLETELNEARAELAEAVKRMEVVPINDLEDTYFESCSMGAEEVLLPGDHDCGLEAVRARIISAAKGEQQ